MLAMLPTSQTPSLLRGDPATRPILVPVSVSRRLCPRLRPRQEERP